MANQRRIRNTKSAALFVASAAAMVAVGTAVAANAEPTVSGATVGEQPDAVFLEALDQIGVGHPNNPQAVSTANNVCQRILDGFSTAETVEGLEDANPGLEHGHAKAFVKVARTVYCPGVGVGELAGYPGRE